MMKWCRRAESNRGPTDYELDFASIPSYFLPLYTLIFQWVTPVIYSDVCPHFRSGDAPFGPVSGGKGDEREDHEADSERPARRPLSFRACRGKAQKSDGGRISPPARQDHPAGSRHTESR